MQILKNRINFFKKDYWAHMVPDKVFLKTLLFMMIPIVLQSLFESMVNLVDMFFVMALNDQSSINAVGAVSNIFQIFFFTIFAVCISGNIYAAQYLGAADYHRLRQTTRFKIVFGFILVSSLTILLFFLRVPIINFYLATSNHSNADVYHRTLSQASRFLGIIMWTFPLIAIILAISTTMNVNKNIKTPLLIAFIALVCNCTLDPIFILNPGHILPEKMAGVYGAAYAALISRILQVVLYVGYLCWRRPIYSPGLKFWVIEANIWKNGIKSFAIVSIGEVFFAFFAVIQTMLINKIAGEDGLTAATFSYTLMDIFFSVFRGYVTAIPYFVGRELGKGNIAQAKDNAKKTLFTIGGISGVLAVFIVIMAVVIPYILPSSLSQSDNASHILSMFLLIQALSYILISISYTINSVIRTGGKVVIPALIDSGYLWLINILLLAIFYVTGVSSITGPLYIVPAFFLVQTLSSLFSMISSFIAYKKLNWARKIVNNDISEPILAINSNKLDVA